MRELRPRDKTVAIIAVDPSSRNTGGALLGDRIRIRSGASDAGVFIRSMAARDQLGGLAESTWAGVTIVAAAFDWVFVETVGVGQSESEIATLVDTLVYVTSPETGDLLQFMKAGILELPDVFVVNKSDLGTAAARTASELRGGVSLGERSQSRPDPTVILASARDGAGVRELVSAIDAHRQHQLENDSLRDKRLRGRATQITKTLERRYGSFGIERLGGRQALRERVRADGAASSVTLLERLGHEIEDVLQKPR